MNFFFRKLLRIPDYGVRVCDLLKLSESLEVYESHCHKRHITKNRHHSFRMVGHEKIWPSRQKINNVLDTNLDKIAKEILLWSQPDLMQCLSMPLPYVFCAKFSKLLVFMMGLNYCIIMGLGFQTEFAGCSLALNIQISHVMRKPTSVIYEKQRRKSASQYLLS